MREVRDQGGGEPGMGGAAAAFFSQAERRLLTVPTARDALAGGDHLLNPGMELGDDYPFRDAAVLVPVFERGNGAAVLLTERTRDLPDHAGQIALPGGKIDPADKDAEAAAIREAEEEIGLGAEAISVIGYLDTYLSRTGFRIVPVVARIREGAGLTPNPREVADVFEVPLDYLLDAANYRHGTRKFGSHTAHFYEIPFGERYIWGVTAGILRSLHERMTD